MWVMLLNLELYRRFFSTGPTLPPDNGVVQVGMCLDCLIAALDTY